MAELSPTKKSSAALSIGRKPGPSPLCIYAHSFHLREEAPQFGLVALAFQAAGKGEMPPRLLFDSTLFRNNKAIFEEYLAKLQCDVDDSSQTQEVVFAPQVLFSNLCHSAYTGNQSETTFSILSFNDWADAKRNTKPGGAASHSALRIGTVVGFPS